MIIDNGNGTYTVKANLWGNEFEEIYDKLYEAEACQAQINILTEQ